MKKRNKKRPEKRTGDTKEKQGEKEEHGKLIVKRAQKWITSTHSALCTVKKLDVYEG